MYKGLLSELAGKPGITNLKQIYPYITCQDLAVCLKAMSTVYAKKTAVGLNNVFVSLSFKIFLYNGKTGEERCLLGGGKAHKGGIYAVSIPSMKGSALPFRPCSHLVPEHDYHCALMWTHRGFIKDPPQNLGTVSVPEYKVETLHSGN